MPIENYRQLAAGAQANGEPSEKLGAWVRVREGEVVVTEGQFPLLGSWTRTLEPGVHFRVPLVEKAYRGPGKEVPHVIDLTPTPNDSDPHSMAAQGFPYLTGGGERVVAKRRLQKEKEPITTFPAPKTEADLHTLELQVNGLKEEYPNAQLKNLGNGYALVEVETIEEIMTEPENPIPVGLNLTATVVCEEPAKTLLHSGGVDNVYRIIQERTPAIVQEAIGQYSPQQIQNPVIRRQIIREVRGQLASRVKDFGLKLVSLDSEGAISIPKQILDSQMLVMQEQAAAQQNLIEAERRMKEWQILAKGAYEFFDQVGITPSLPEIQSIVHSILEIDSRDDIMDKLKDGSSVIINTGGQNGFGSNNGLDTANLNRLQKLRQDVDAMMDHLNGNNGARGSNGNG